MLVVHHLNNSRSQRVLWLLEELDVPYEVKRYERDAATMLAPPTLRAVHPLGKSPVVTDLASASGGPPGAGTTLAESGAILEYLVHKYGNGRLIPATDTPERLRYTYWLHYAEGSLMPPLLLKLVFTKVETGRMPFFVRPIAKQISARVHKAFITPQLETHLDFIEAELGKSRWFAGDELTAADVQMSYPLEAASARGVVGANRPRVTDFVKRIHERPAYRRALERGGPYDYTP